MKTIFSIAISFGLFFAGCRSTNLDFVDYKSDDLSGFFSDSKSDSYLQFFSSFAANSNTNKFYYRERVGEMEFNNQNERNAVGKGYFKVNGERFSTDQNNSFEVKKIFTNNEVTIQLVGDTLGLPTTNEFKVATSRPFTLFSLSSNIIRAGDDMQLSWNPSGDGSAQMLIKISVLDVATTEEYRTNQWNKVTEDDGSYTVPGKVFDNFQFKGQFRIQLVRANVEHETKKGKTLEVLFLSTATNTFERK